MSPDLERSLTIRSLQIRCDQARRGIDACRRMGQWSRNLRWSREAANWQDVLDAAEKRLAELATRPSVGPEDHANS